MAIDAIPGLRLGLERLVALGARSLQMKPDFPFDNLMARMALLFSVKQQQHARTILMLGHSNDTVLIARSMLEGMCQLAWAHRCPADRPYRWVHFGCVRDWRQMKRMKALGESVPADREREVLDALTEYGDRFLTPEGRQRRDNGKHLNDASYVKTWYSKSLRDIFNEVKGTAHYDQTYVFFSEWHHWDFGGLGHLLVSNDNNDDVQVSTRHPGFTATSLATAFWCLWETLNIQEQEIPTGTRDDLDELKLQSQQFDFEQSRSE